MDLMEYKSKELFDHYHIPTMNGFVVDDLKNLEHQASTISYPVVVKAQVQTGGRGKAGGILFANDEKELFAASKKIMGMDIKGHKVEKLLVVEKMEASTEWYLSIMLDRFSKCPIVIFSPVGGMEIEETARTAPHKVIKASIDPLIGVKDYLPRYLLSKSGCEMQYLEPLFALLKDLYHLFCEVDCLLVEINPLVISAEKRLVALDAKISVDESALSRQPDILAFRDSLPEDERVLEARKYNFLYIPCEAGANIGVMSNGSGMIMSCIDLLSNQGMNVGAALDLGGGATADRIQEGIRIILSNANIKALFINIFGGITRCDEVASGIRMAVENHASDKLLIVRLEGTNKQAGLDILSAIGGNVVSVDGIREGVAKIVKRKGQL